MDSRKSKYFSLLSLSQSALALLLIFLCLLAAQWQYHRGVARSHANSTIRNNQSLPPLSAAQLAHVQDSASEQWRAAILSGTFDQSHQLLVRDRYSQGQFGFEVLNLFHSEDGQNYWIDRGWVAAGKSASTPPTIPALSSELVTITARIRSDDLTHQIAGSFFATIPSKRTSTHLDSVQGVRAAPYYLDLLAPKSAPIALTRIELPDLSNGPHFAYALQWLLFAAIILIGRIAIFREIGARKDQSTSPEL
jgi:cytochrome oxidase assembly protein ShyY1